MINKRKVVREVRILSADARRLVYDMITLMQQGQNVEAFKLLLKVDAASRCEAMRFFDVILEAE